MIEYSEFADFWFKQACAATLLLKDCRKNANHILAARLFGLQPFVHGCEPQVNEFDKDGCTSKTPAIAFFMALAAQGLRIAK